MSIGRTRFLCGPGILGNGGGGETAPERASRVISDMVRRLWGAAYRALTGWGPDTRG